jgi:flavin reductase (DIM6/NTAB) family NADH-FMN oxidoreductase RutF
VVGQVIGVHIDPAYIEDGRLLTAKLQPIARCGYREEYTVVRELFAMWRPT